jgi:hypothetical protein
MKVQIQNETWDAKRCWEYLTNKNNITYYENDTTFILGKEAFKLFNENIEKDLKDLINERNKTTNRRNKYKRI